jgi:hypothetical protein
VGRRPAYRTRLVDDRVDHRYVTDAFGRFEIAEKPDPAGARSDSKPALRE